MKENFDITVIASGKPKWLGKNIPLLDLLTH